MRNLTAIISTICVIFINDTAATRYIPGFPFDNRPFAFEPVVPIYGDSMGSKEVWKEDELYFNKRNNLSDSRHNYLKGKIERKVKEQTQMRCKEICTPPNLGENDKRYDNRAFTFEPVIPIYGGSVGSNEVWKEDNFHFTKRNNISDYKRNYLMEKTEREVKDQPQMLCKEIRTSLNVGENDKGYDYRPSTINLVLCDNKISDRSLVFQCGVDQCRNNIVDVDIYRKKKNSDDNCWEFVTSMPVSAGCECHGLKAEYTKQPKKKLYPSVQLEGRNLYQKRQVID